MRYFFLFIILISFGCNDDNETPLEPLEGKWVEKINRQDTIIFNSNLNGNDSQYFIFKSVQEISGYNGLHSTTFEYIIEKDKISLYNSISSCYCFTDYSFSQKGNNIFIQNFYDLNEAGKVETFEKLN